MTVQIRRSDYPDYASYMDAIAEPIGGATTGDWKDSVHQPPLGLGH